MKMRGVHQSEQEVRMDFSRFFQVFRFGPRALSLVWKTSPVLMLLLATLTVFAGLLPAAIAYVGKWIVDAVVLAAKSELPSDRWVTLTYVGYEALLVVALAAAQKGLQVSQSLLRALLGNRVNVMILEKALILEVKHFENAGFYDKMTRARREASIRPLSLVNRTFGLIQNAISLLTYGGLLLQFSGWAVLVLVVAALPAFFAETRFSGAAFRLFRWKVPETRQQAYLEMVLTREDYVKEVKLLQIGRILLERYQEIFDRLYGEDRALALRRGFWGYFFGLLSTFSFYASYAWIAYTAALGRISLGEMMMYLLVFKQGQAAVTSSLSSIGGMYEDNLYLSNLFEFLDERIEFSEDSGLSEGPLPGDGVRFENVSFIYSGSEEPALSKVSLHLEPGQKLALVGENGSGKTTLIKLLTRLYLPSSGRILLDGLDLNDWSRLALRRRIGVIFQDFVRYQFSVGENIGVGDVEHFSDQERWEVAAAKGMAEPFINEMPDGFQTQLGRWFKNGRELSLGQWQKIALSRAFMRESADILVLDEPTSAMDAEAEAKIFSHFREVTEKQMAILISHRFSTVRMADQIIVLHKGKVLESGTHEELMDCDSRYAHLFSLQAKGYM